MKNYLSILYLAALLSVLPACSWIAEDPQSLVMPNDIPDSEEGCAQWVTGVYSKWIYDMFCWGYFPKVLEFDADYITGPDWLFGTFGAGNFQGESDITDALWNGCYGLIGRAELAETQIAAMQNISAEVRNNAIGECRFHKALAYFLLVRAYGDIPLLEDPNSANIEDKSQPRQPIAAVYQEICTLLEDASKRLYKNTHANYQPGHVCAGSAAGLLAKVYATMASAAMPEGTPVVVRTGAAYTDLNGEKTFAPLVSLTLSKQTVAGYEQMDYTKYYRLASEYAKALMDGEYGDHTLLPYDQLWLRANACASEFLFSVGSVSGDAVYKNSVHTLYEGYVESAGSELIASGGWCGCTRHWYDLFDPADYRVVYGVKHRWRYYYQEESNTAFFYPYNDTYQAMVNSRQAPFDDGLNYYATMDAQCLAFTTKYADVTDNSIEYADANFPMLRLADVYLIYAEAENELGNADNALTYLNKVRERSHAPLANAVSDKNTLRSLIIEERAKELACEADRHWDLIRWGIYLDAMNAVSNGTYTDDGHIVKTREKKHLLFPIPQAELNTNRLINQNNPGWN
ncbi:MAG: RagB/SusD family nutrient uptake outer membrane protein [Paludibacteraceae bacterium]